MTIDREALKAFKSAPAPRQSMGGQSVAPSPAQAAAPVAAAEPVSSVKPVDTTTQVAPDASSAPVGSSDVSAVATADSTTAPAPVSETTETTAPADDQQAAPPEGGKPVGRARDRIEDLSAQLKATREYAEYQARVIKDMTSRNAAPAAPATASAPASTTTDDSAPTLEQNEFDSAKLAKAQAAWLAQQVDKRVAAAMQGQTAQQQAQVVRQAFETRMEAFKATATDFDIVVANPALPPLSTTAAKLVIASDKGPQIVYHLAKNPNVAAHIARLAPEQQAMALGRLEAQLSTAAAPPVQQKTVSTTKAPPPPSSTPSGGASGGSRDPSKMAMKEFVENERRIAADKRARLKARRQ